MEDGAAVCPLVAVPLPSRLIMIMGGLTDMYDGVIIVVTYACMMRTVGAFVTEIKEPSRSMIVFVGMKSE